MEPEDNSDNYFKENDQRQVGEDDDEVGTHDNVITPKDMDSGNVSPESLQLSSFRDDSRLSNLTPTIAYTPETFLIEQEENEEDNFE